MRSRSTAFPPLTFECCLSGSQCEAKMNQLAKQPSMPGRWLAAVGAVVGAACAVLVQAATAAPTLLVDAGTGRILYAEDADDLWHPASLTKIMTAYLTFQALKAGKITLETQIPYSEAAWNQPPSKIGLPVGSTITVDVALQALVVKSANDIAVALAEAIGGNEAQFVEHMNATAKRLGMSRTQFRNPHGLPAAEQVTTARDLARLSMAVVRDFPERTHYWSQQQMQIGKINITSHNGLFKTFEGTDGMKTGFICDSGYNIVASANREGARLLAVVLGQPTVGDRNLRAHELLAHGYSVTSWKALFGNDTVTTLPISAGAKNAESIRESVVAFECNNRRMARAAAAARKRTKARKVAEASAKKPAASSTDQKSGDQKFGDQKSGDQKSAGSAAKASTAAGKGQQSAGSSSGPAAPRTPSAKAAPAPVAQ